MSEVRHFEIDDQDAPAVLDDAGAVLEAMFALEAHLVAQEQWFERFALASGRPRSDDPAVRDARAVMHARLDRMAALRTDVAELRADALQALPAESRSAPPIGPPESPQLGWPEPATAEALRAVAQQSGDAMGTKLLDVGVCARALRDRLAGNGDARTSQLVAGLDELVADLFEAPH